MLKVTIVGGAGTVGAGAGFSLVNLGGIDELVLVDAFAQMAEAHALDMSHVPVLGPPMVVRAGTMADVEDADVTVLAVAGPKPGPGSTRMDQLLSSAGILRGMLPALRVAVANGVLVVATNPVDAICTWLHRQLGAKPLRIVGYALNDSVRLRMGVAEALQIEPWRVQAWVLGEHGEHQVALYDRITIDGKPTVLTPTQKAVAQGFIDGWFARWQGLNTGRSTGWSTGNGLARLVSMLSGQLPPATVPCSVTLAGEYGLEGVSIGVPLRLGQTVGPVEVWDLQPEQLRELHLAAAVTLDAAARIDQE